MLLFREEADESAGATGRERPAPDAGDAFARGGRGPHKEGRQEETEAGGKMKGERGMEGALPL